jgi:long-chain acyl-CoA synthetase
MEENLYIYDKPDNLVEMVEDSIERNAQLPLFGTPDSQGNYSWVTYGEVGARIDALRAALHQLGITAGDAVGVIANNSVEWAVAAFAAFGLGARFIPM